MRLLYATSFALAACLAHADILLGVDFGGQAYRIDSSTGVGQALGPGGMGPLNSLAYHHGVYYAAGQGTELLSIDPVLGTSSLAATLSKGDVRGLASFGDKLFGILQGPTFDDPDLLAEVDPLTGIVTTIGNLGWPYSGVQALAADANSLYGWDAVEGLIKVDSLTGAVTDVGTWGGTTDVQTLEFLGDGTLVGGRDQLLSIDLTTGGWSLIGSGGYTDVRGLAVVPEPSTMVAWRSARWWPDAGAVAERFSPD